MAHDIVAESALYLRAHSVELRKLLLGVGVELGTVGSGQVGEERLDAHYLLAAQQVDQFGKLLGSETEAVHAGVELYVYREIGDAAFLALADDLAEYREGVYLRFEPIGEHRLVIDHMGVHHHHGHCDARFAQLYALVEHGHGHICRSLGLEGFGELVASGAVARGFDHADYAGGGAEHGAVDVEVGHEGVEIHLQDGLMLACLKHFGDQLEVEARGSLDKHELAVEIVGRHLREHDRGRREEPRIGRKIARIGRDLFAHADHAVDSALGEQSRHLAVEALRLQGLVHDVGNDRSDGSPAGAPAVEEVESGLQGVEIGGIGVVDHQTVVYPLLHLHARGHRSQLRHA